VAEFVISDSVSEIYSFCFLQGVHPCRQGPSPTRGLHDNRGLEGRVLPRPVTSTSSEVLPIRVARETLPVQLSSVRLDSIARVVPELHSPHRLHLSTTGDPDGRLFGRLSDPGIHQVPGGGGNTFPAPTSTALRVHTERGEVRDLSVPDSRISGNDYRLEIHDTFSPGGQVVEISSSRQENATQGTSEPAGGGLRPTVTGGETPIVFPVHPGVPPEAQWTHLFDEQGFGPTYGRHPLGAGDSGLDLLDGLSCPVEWKGHTPLQPQTEVHDGCWPPGLGRIHDPSPSASGNPGSFPTADQVGFDQREGTAGGLLLSASVRSPVQVVELQDLGDHRLDDGADLHQQDGGTSALPGGGHYDDPRLRTTASHPTASRVHLDLGEQDRGSSVKGIRKSPNRTDAGPEDLHKAGLDLGSSRGGLFRDDEQLSVATLRLVASRSLRPSHGLHVPGGPGGDPVRVPSILHDSPDSHQSGEGVQDSDIDRSVLANASVLARAAEPAVRLADLADEERPIASEGSVRPDGVPAGSAAPRLLHLWDTASEKGLSRAAWEYGLRAYKRNNKGKSPALSAHECTFRKYQVYRTSGVDLAPVFSVESIMNAAVWNMEQGHITEGGIRVFLSAFADINPDLGVDPTVKKLRTVSKRNQKVLSTTFTKIVC
jgi:hypothetical protein